MRLIDSDAIIDALNGIWTAEFGAETVLAVRDVTEIIKTAPTVEQKRGRWINYPECLRYDGAYCVEHIVCSNCESVWNIIDNDADRFDYCPHCGAKMEVETDDTEGTRVQDATGGT